MLGVNGVADGLARPMAAQFDEEQSPIRFFTDPKRCLLRFDAENAEVWLDGPSLVAGVKSLLGINSKEDYKDDQAHAPL